MSEQAGSRYRRLVLDLGHGAGDAETLRAAAEFARLLGLDLHGLFIEDEALLTLADLPFAREIRLPTYQWSALDAQTVAAELRVTAARMRRLLDEITQSVGVTSVFEVLRGDPAACIAALSRAGDIVAFAEPGPRVIRARHGVARVEAVTDDTAASVLLLPASPMPRNGPVVAVLTDAADHSLDVACRVAAAANEGLVVLLPEAGAEAAVRDRAQALGVPPERIAVRQTGVPGVADALAGLRERLIVMARTGAAAASQIAAARGVPVLLVTSALQAAGGDAPARPGP
jgi:hypothetical protein